MDNMRRGFRTVEAPKPPIDLLKRKYRAIDEMKSQSSEQNAIKISMTIFNELAEKTHYAVEATYSFNERIHKLEQEKLYEKKEYEQKIQNLKEMEQKKLAEDNMSGLINIPSKSESGKRQEVSQTFDPCGDIAMQEKLGYKKEQDDLTHKFDVSQKKKEDRIQELSKERNDCLKRYTDHIFGLYKSSFAIDYANKLADKQFKRDLLVAATSSLNNTGLKSNNNLGELIKNILKSVLEGKL